MKNTKFYKIKKDSPLYIRIENHKKYFIEAKSTLIDFLSKYTEKPKDYFAIDNFFSPYVLEEKRGEIKGLKKTQEIEGYCSFIESSKILKAYREFFKELKIEGLQCKDLALNTQIISFGFGFFGLEWTLNAEKFLMELTFDSEYSSKERDRVLEEKINENLIEIEELEYQEIKLKKQG